MRTSSNHRPHLTATVIGGAITGLMAAYELAMLCKRLGMPIAVRLFEAGAFGGSAADRTASSKCQQWLHRQGVLFFKQPEVCLNLQWSVQRLRRLAPHAFRWPIALAIDPAGDWPPAPEFFGPLRIWHQAVSRPVLRTWFPEIRLPEDCQAYRVLDGTIQLRLLAHAIKTRLHRLHVSTFQQRVIRFELRGAHVSRLIFEHNDPILVGPKDVVVFACGAHLRPLLAKVGLGVAGLRLFRSHLVASTQTGIRGLLGFLWGGVNCVPYEGTDGQLVNLFGNSKRVELPLESDGRPLVAEPAAIDRLVQEVEEQLGVKIPSSQRLAWPAVKTEITSPAGRSQAHHAQLIPGLANAWFALPGKLSQSAACARDLAGKIIHHTLDDSIALPIWEQPELAASQPAEVPWAA